MDYFLEQISSVIYELVSYLPDSPFLMIEKLEDSTWLTIIKYLDYIMNISALITITTYWVTCVLIVQVASPAMRYVKMIGD